MTELTCCAKDSSKAPHRSLLFPPVEDGGAVEEEEDSALFLGVRSRLEASDLNCTDRERLSPDDLGLAVISSPCASRTVLLKSEGVRIVLLKSGLALLSSLRGGDCLLLEKREELRERFMGEAEVEYWALLPPAVLV